MIYDFVAMMQAMEGGRGAMWKIWGGMSSGFCPLCHQDFVHYVIRRWMNGRKADAKT
jgi:hypothetical protein